MQEFALKLEVLGIAKERGYLLPIGFMQESFNTMLHRVCRDLKAANAIEPGPFINGYVKWVAAK